MAERPSVQEILARVRAGGPAQPADEPAAPEAPVVEVEADEPSSAPEPPAVAAPPPAAPAPPTGRPLTLKEKLAAARAGGAAAPAPAATAPSPPAAIEEPAAEEVSPAEAAPAVPAPAAPVGRPLTLKEKLAAARGAAPAAGAAPAGTAKPAAKAATAAPAAAKVATTRALPPLAQATDPKDLAEHLRRAGAERDKADKAAAAAQAATAAGATPAAAQVAAKAATTKKVESKAVPPRPSKAAATATAGQPTRRAVLVGFASGLLTSWVFWAWASFTAASVAFLSACARFMFPNVLAEPPSTIKVGLPTNFELGEVNERWKAEWGFWIVRSDAYDGQDKIYALSTICTHLGCPPNWLAAEAKFKCPCHGSGFYVSGVNFEGPAPRPLERYKISVGDDGQLVVDKSQKFQQELGQWTDPDSYIQV